MFTLAIDDGGIARIAIDRPEARNAVTVAGWQRLAAVIGEVRHAEPKVLLLHAAPGAIFSAGADLDELAALAGHVDRRAPFRTAMTDALAAVRALAMPTIAAVERGCYGAGVALAMACDLRVAGRDARFSIPPARLGILYPHDDVQRLVALVGEAQAIRLLASGDTIDADEAARIGLVEIVAADARAAAEALAARIAANARASVVELKAFVRPGAAVPPPDLFDDGFGSAAFVAWARARREGGGR